MAWAGNLSRLIGFCFIDNHQTVCCSLVACRVTVTGQIPTYK
eukprot:SAG11_NODE_661_length_7885_cov_8.956974_13_plen_42_part_00